MTLCKLGRSARSYDNYLIIEAEQPTNNAIYLIRASFDMEYENIAEAINYDTKRTRYVDVHHVLYQENQKCFG